MSSDDGQGPARPSAADSADGDVDAVTRLRRILDSQLRDPLERAESDGDYDEGSGRSEADYLRERPPHHGD